MHTLLCILVMNRLIQYNYFRSLRVETTVNDINNVIFARFFFNFLTDHLYNCMENNIL